MFNAQLVRLLKTDSLYDSDYDIYVYIEDDLYYPIKTVQRDKDGNYIIVCKNIKNAKPE